MVRFLNGVPDVVYYSEHSGGAAYKYSAVEKVDDRPVCYIATGTHANYAVCPSPAIRRVLSLTTGAKTSGDHTYNQVPGVNSTDQTNKGLAWDVAKNFRGFWYTPSNGQLSLALGTGIGGAVEISEGFSWLNFGGYWGDQAWPTTRPGQYCENGECLVSDGPTGELATSVGTPWEPLSLTGPSDKVPCLKTLDALPHARTKVRAMSKPVCNHWFVFPKSWTCPRLVYFFVILSTYTQLYEPLSSPVQLLYQQYVPVQAQSRPTPTYHKNSQSYFTVRASSRQTRARTLPTKRGLAAPATRTEFISYLLWGALEASRQISVKAEVPKATERVCSVYTATAR